MHLYFALTVVIVRGLKFNGGKQHQSLSSEAQLWNHGVATCSHTNDGDVSLSMAAGEHTGLQRAKTREILEQSLVEMNHCVAGSVAKEAHLDLLDPHVVVYLNDEDYINFRGLRLVPEKKDSVKRVAYQDPFERIVPDEIGVNPRVMLTECESTFPEFTWHVQRIGPFISNGNYSWHQFGWRDVGHLSRRLQSQPDLYIVDRFLKTVDESGKTLSNPPIHIHHLHVTPGQAFGRFSWPRDMCKDTNHYQQDCYVPAYFLEQHGEFECRSVDGGETCGLAPYPSGYGFHVRKALDFEGELNDMRAPHSADLMWWLQIALKVSSGPIKPLSNILITNAGLFDPNNQKTYEGYFMVPTDRPTVVWYSGRMPDSGRLVRNRWHVHQNVNAGTLLFHANKEQLGLKGAWGSDVSHPAKIGGLGAQTLDLAELGHSTFGDLKMSLLAKASSSKTSQAPALICSGCPDLEQIGAFEYDRKGMHACVPWSFQTNDPFTVIGFLNYTGAPLFAPSHRDIPPFGVMHLQFFWIYEATDGKSRSGLLAALGDGHDPDQNLTIFFNAV